MRLLSGLSPFRPPNPTASRDKSELWTRDITSLKLLARESIYRRGAFPFYSRGPVMAVDFNVLSPDSPPLSLSRYSRNTVLESARYSLHVRTCAKKDEDEEEEEHFFLLM